jgi:hypothetical protein
MSERYFRSKTTARQARPTDETRAQLDNRYSRDRLRMDVALRFLRYEARTHTIRTWTGLPDDRIRKLYRAYLSDDPTQAPRHRGRPPRQASFFTRSHRMQHEASILASLLCMVGVMPDDTPANSIQPLPSAARGELLCDAFDAYRSLVRSPRISFEHAVFLVIALARGDELTFSGCCQCGSLMVVDRLVLGDVRCSYCTMRARKRGEK